jgi:hypothetical protein
MRERTIFEKMGNSPEAKKEIALVRSERPLVVVGPFAVFVNNDNSEFSVKDRTKLVFPFLIWGIHEQSKRLELFSLCEEDWAVSRFSASLYYSEDGDYERGGFTVRRKDASLVRAYIDDEGNGVFNRMVVDEDGERVTYHLNGLTWEKVDEQPLNDNQEVDVDQNDNEICIDN